MGSNLFRAGSLRELNQDGTKRAGCIHPLRKRQAKPNAVEA